MTTSHQIKAVQQAICCPDGCKSPGECEHLEYRDEARAVMAVTDAFEEVPLFHKNISWSQYDGQI